MMMMMMILTFLPCLLTGSALICRVPAQWLVILDTIIIIIFIILSVNKAV